MNEVFLHMDRSARWETGQFNQLVAIGDLQKGELRSARRRFPLTYFKPQDGCIKLNRLIQITDPHTCMQELCNFHRAPLTITRQSQECRHLGIQSSRMTKRIRGLSLQGRWSSEAGFLRCPRSENSAWNRSPGSPASRKSA